VLLVGPAAPALACDSSTETTFGVSPGCFDVQFSGAPDGDSLAPGFFQAGGHPDLFQMALKVNAPAAGSPLLGPYWPPEPIKDVQVELPAGVVADPTGVAPCSLDRLGEVAGLESAPMCPPASQVGTVTITIPFPEGQPLVIAGLPLYNLKPSPGSVARFGLNLLGLVTAFDAKLLGSPRSGLRVELSGLNQGVPVIGLEVFLWGTPADQGHDGERACPGAALPGLGGGPACPAGAPRKAFLRMPTSCTGPTRTSLQVDSWSRPGVFQTASVTGHHPPSLFGDPAEPASYPAPYPGLDAAQWGPPAGLTGCGGPGFDPSLSVQPTSSAAAEPTGLDVRLRLDQEGLGDPDAVASSDLRDARVELPPGLTANPSVANGLASCSDHELGLDSDRPPSCPAASTLGTVEARSPLLEAPLRGSIYFSSASPTPAGLRLSVNVVAGNEAAIVKLPAQITVDRATGQMTTVLRDLPQVPIAELRLSFFSGERAPFVNPGVCGSFASVGRFTPWARSTETEVVDRFSLDRGRGGGPCPAEGGSLPLNPRFVAGLDRPIAGASTPLRLELGRDEGQQVLTSFHVSLPAGLSASLGELERCSEASLAAISGRALDGRAELTEPSCPLASALGKAAVAVGSGSEPLRLSSGRVYLAGPYDGAPLSLAIVIPAVSGQVDLGTVMARAKLALNPDSGRLALSGGLPTTQQGVPLGLRSIALEIDRPGVIRAPTHCRRGSIVAWVGGAAGAVARVSSPFQVHDCDKLDFRPGLRVRLLGKGAARHGAHPQMRFVVRPRPGDANLAGATIELPESEQLDPTRLRAICSVERFEAEQCPAGSRYGRVVAVSPALGRALTGAIYLRESKRGFPDLAVRLRGEFELSLTGRIVFAGGRIRLVLRRLPDLPLTKLELTLAGGRRGLLVNNRNLCRQAAGIAATMRGANGGVAVSRTALRVSCPSG
jgi:hypothetical protein